MPENEFKITVKLKDGATVTELCTSTPLDANGNQEIFRLSDPNGR